MYNGMLAETIAIPGHNGDLISAYLARPLGPGPYPGVVIAHHMPGWDAWYLEATRAYAQHGYIALCPNLYHRSGHGEPQDVAAKVRAEGGVPDTQAVGDLAGALAYLRALPQLNGKVGVWGTCSGGRHAYLAACLVPGFDAVVDCWGGRVVMTPEQLNDNFPVAPIDYTDRLNAPLLGLFGAEDRSPTPEQVAQHEAKLQELGKDYEFHMYEGAGHGFFYHNRPAYRQQQAVDGWNKIWRFLAQHLDTPAPYA
jgi:carboxymethylenebutenolidase